MMSMNDDDLFLERVTDRLAALPGVRAVSLGGSRAQGTHRPDSDWDLAVYYRPAFNPQLLRDLGWEGEVSEVGAWAGGVFNGCAWLTIEGRRVDVHYRDLDVVEHELAEAREGRFRLGPLMFYLAGVPSYTVVAELALGRVLRGELPRPEFPERLRQSAPRVWWDFAETAFFYTLEVHAKHGRFTQCVGLVAMAALFSAHAVLAARGEWITNEKTLLTRAGLREVDALLDQASLEPERLVAVLERCRDLCASAVRSAG